MAGDGLNHASMTLTEQLPILQVLVPFVAAPLIVFIGSRALAWPIAFASSVASFAIAVTAVGPGDRRGRDLISYRGVGAAAWNRIPCRRHQCLCLAVDFWDQQRGIAVCPRQPVGRIAATQAYAFLCLVHAVPDRVCLGW